MVAQQLAQLLAVGRVLVDAQLEVLGELLVELGVLVLVLRHLEEEVEALLDEVLADDLEDLVLLQALARDVERQVLAVHHALDEAQVLRDELLAVVHDEDAAHVELDVVGLLARGLEEVEGRALGQVDDALELHRALDAASEEGREGRREGEKGGETSGSRRYTHAEAKKRAARAGARTHLKCFQASASSQSFVSDLKKELYSSSVTSSGLRIQIGLVLLSSCHSFVTSCGRRAWEKREGGRGGEV